MRLNRSDTQDQEVLRSLAQLSTAATSLQAACEYCQIRIDPCDSQILSLRPIERSVESRTHRANIGASSRPFILPRPDEELDSCLFNVDPHFDFRMQIEDGKNVIVDSVMFASNAIHGLYLHGFALSTETRLAISHFACRSEWAASKPQHTAMLSLEHALEHYMFLLIRRLHRNASGTSQRTHRTNFNISPQHGTRSVARARDLIGRCNWNGARRSLGFLERACLFPTRFHECIEV